MHNCPLPKGIISHTHHIFMVIIFGLALLSHHHHHRCRRLIAKLCELQKFAGYFYSPYCWHALSGQ